MAVRHGLEDFFAEQLTEFHDPFLVTRWTEVPPFTRKGQQIFMAAFPTFDPRKAIMKDATIKEPVDYLSHVGAEETVLLGEPLIIDLFQFLKTCPVKCRFAALLWRI